jgi:hypothetical protein
MRMIKLSVKYSETETSQYGRTFALQLRTNVSPSLRAERVEAWSPASSKEECTLNFEMANRSADQTFFLTSPPSPGGAIMIEPAETHTVVVQLPRAKPPPELEDVLFQAFDMPPPPAVQRASAPPSKAKRASLAMPPKETPEQKLITWVKAEVLGKLAIGWNTASGSHGVVSLAALDVTMKMVRSICMAPAAISVCLDGVPVACGTASTRINKHALVCVALSVTNKRQAKPIVGPLVLRFQAIRCLDNGSASSRLNGQLVCVGPLQVDIPQLDANATIKHSVIVCALDSGNFTFLIALVSRTGDTIASTLVNITVP